MQVQGAQSYVARQHAGHNLALEERGRGFDGVREADASLLCAELVDGLLPPVARASEQGRTQQTEGLEERGELGAGAGAELSEPNSQLHLAHGACGHHELPVAR